MEIGDKVKIRAHHDTRNIGLVGKIVHLGDCYCVLEYDVKMSIKFDYPKRSPYVMGQGSPLIASLDSIEGVAS